ncbi:phospholipase A [Sulfuricurvum sp.]|uniref:phospholipase A n=1 Tax=Sulfuricurvum sp. TaxID=2025608 RepID=UPI003C34D4EB
MNDEYRCVRDGGYLPTKTFIALMLFVSCSVLAIAAQGTSEGDHSSEVYFNNQEYAKALPLLEEEAIKGLKPSIYRLAHMYQNGLGVRTDYKKAAFWFQQAASDYSYTLAMESEAKKEKKSFFENLNDQMNPETNREGAATILRTIDTDTPETYKLVEVSRYGGFFGLRPYETNYISPFGYSTHKYPRLSSTLHPNYYPSEYYDKNIEAEFQISLTKMLIYNLFGWNEYLNFAYTQKVWWQCYSASNPFRETNYLPEMFIGIPLSESIRQEYGLKLAKLGIMHESNGQDGYRSRSWNRIYLSGIWQWENLFLTTRVWHKMAERKKYDGYFEGEPNPATGEYEPDVEGDDNPDIENYLGYGDVKLTYLYGEHEIGSLFRYNFGAGGKARGAIDFHWSYPFLNSENTFWYVKVFSGYGESLIDYDRSTTKALIGFSFSRDVF